MKAVSFMLKALLALALFIGFIVLANIAGDQYDRYQEVGNYYQAHYHLLDIIAVYIVAGLLLLSACGVAGFALADAFEESEEEEEEPEPQPRYAGPIYPGGTPTIPIQLLVLMEIIEMEEEIAARAERARRKAAEKAEQDEPQA
jgi:hypothetical protein